MKKKSSDRELIDTGTDKRFVRRDEQGRFTESDDVGRSLPRTSENTRRPRPDLAKATKGTGSGSKGLPHHDEDGCCKTPPSDSASG